MSSYFSRVASMDLFHKELVCCSPVKSLNWAILLSNEHSDKERPRDIGPKESSQCPYNVGRYLGRSVGLRDEFDQAWACGEIDDRLEIPVRLFAA